MKIFGNQRMIRRISEAGPVRKNYKNVERNILQFEGYDTEDYERLTMVRKDGLQFMGWLLGLETDRSVDGLPVFVQPTKR
jgi:hypothetical protein